MPPIWLCPDCRNVAYGWARGPCIHCGSRRVVSTDPSVQLDENSLIHQLLYLSDKEWAQLEAEAVLAGLSTRALLAEREQREVVLIRDEPVRHGRLVLLKAISGKTEVRQYD